MAKETTNEQQAQIAEAVSKTDLFFQNNKKTIMGITIAVIVIVLGTLGYYRFIRAPKVAECRAQMFPAENAFKNDQFEEAFLGDGSFIGFEEIINTYGCAVDASAYLYAGICQLQLGNYESAISYLKGYKGKEVILAARALSCIGDAYVGLGNNAEALTWYLKAANKADNIFAATYLLKAGIVCEELGDNAQALTLYKKIKDQYANSIEGYEIDKYISRIEK